MATTAADIGANFSDYKGDPFLGGANEGVININTQPLMQLAQFTFYSKRDKWQKQQQETDAKIRELADISKIKLNDLRGKDKEQMTTEFADLINYYKEYATKDPKTTEEKMKLEIEKQTKYGAFNNNYGSGKSRAVKFETEKNRIIEKYPNNLKAQEIAIKSLEKKFDESDISTPISDVNIFTIEKPELPKALTHTIHKVAIGANHDVAVDMTYFNPISNAGLSWATANGVAKLNVPKTIKDSSGKVVANPEYESQKEYQDIQATGQGQAEIWAAMAEPINEVLSNYVKNGVFDEVNFRKEVKGNLVLAPILEAIDAVNEYKRVKQEQISQGMFKDDTGKQFALPTDIKAEDFDRMGIDLSKGNITPDKLALAGIFAQYNGDVVAKKLTENDNAIQIQANESANERARLNERGANYRAELDLIGKGWVRDAKGKLQPPKANATTTVTNGGVVPYWENYISPQINNANDLKIITKKGGWFSDDIKADLPKDYTGDITVKSDKISGLGIALTDEVGADGKKISYNAKSKTKIRFANGVPIGVVINNVFYDQNDFNSKATRLQDKNVNNKFDAPVFDGNTTQPLPQNQKVNSKGLPIF